jgi:hypothetical protein
VDARLSNYERNDGSANGSNEKSDRLTVDECLDPRSRRNRSRHQPLPPLGAAYAVGFNQLREILCRDRHALAREPGERAALAALHAVAITVLNARDAACHFGRVR